MFLRGVSSSGVLLWSAVISLSAAAGGDQSRYSARLLDAVKAGDHAAVRTLLKASVDTNEAEADGATPLLWAVRNDDVETSQLLLRAGARATVANRNGVTPLSLAALNGNAVILDALLNAGADPNRPLLQGDTVLMRAARTGNPEAVRILLAGGADVNAREPSFGQTALMWAAAEDHGEVTRLLAAHGAAVNTRSDPLTFPRDRFGLEGVSTILPKGNWTPLMFAARQGALEGVRALVEAKADLNVVDSDGTTALLLAIINRHFDVAAFLTEEGADPNVADTAGMAALYAAVDMNTLGEIFGRPAVKPKPTAQVTCLQLIALLLAHGADPHGTLTSAALQKSHTPGDATLGAGATPLMRAAKAGDHAVLQLLLEHGADVNRAQKNQATALMMASGLGRGQATFAQDVGTEVDLLESANLLVAHSANVNALNDAGQTALHFAAQMGADSVVRLLVARGASLNVTDRQGRTPVDLALGVGVRGRAGGPITVHHETAALLRQLGATSGTPVKELPPSR